MLNWSDLFKLGVFRKVQTKLSSIVFNNNKISRLITNVKVSVFVDLMKKSLKNHSKKSMKIFEIFSFKSQFLSPF